MMRPGREWMRLEPQRSGCIGRIYSYLPPPRGLVATAMYLAMVSSTQGHGELIADLAPECAALCKAQMVRICRLTTANQTRLLGHMSDVIAISYATRFGQSQQALVNHHRSRPGLGLLG